MSRSRECVEKLASEVAADPSGEIDMNEFFLYETQAQLQLAMFGNSDEFMRESNEGIRGVFADTADPRYGREWGLRVLDGSAAGVGRVPVAPSDAVPPGCPMHRAHRPDAVAAAQRNRCPAVPEHAHAAGITGPLTRKLMDSQANFPSRWGNTMLFAFAGHDTTGHTLTWLAFELSKNPHIQDRLIVEVDAFWAAKQKQGGLPVVYEDFERLPFMTRCIMETLRRWPAVGNGTYREIEFDETVLVRQALGCVRACVRACVCVRVRVWVCGGGCRARVSGEGGGGAGTNVLYVRTTRACVCVLLALVLAPSVPFHLRSRPGWRGVSVWSVHPTTPTTGWRCRRQVGGAPSEGHLRADRHLRAPPQL